jgi:endonuclease/exonuclease/phosphatase family metal-dependent hydrolase
VLHWNTHHGGVGTDGRYDPDRLVNWIVRMNPDVMSLNEVTAADVDAIASRLNAKTGRTWKGKWDGRGNLLLTRLAVNATSICVTNSSVGRMAAHLTTTVNGRTLNIWSVHLANDSSSARIAESKAVEACASQWAEARIVAGDFNQTSTRAEIQEMTASYNDAWAAAKAMGTARNYSGNCDGCTHNYRIDYVFTSKNASFLKLKSAEIVDTRDADGVRPSDHKPLLVIYTVN